MDENRNVRKKGESCGKYVIENYLIVKLAQSYPEPILQPDLIRQTMNTYNIIEKIGMYRHLSNLEQDNYVIKSSVGAHTTKNVILNDLEEVFTELTTMLLHTEFRNEYIKSTYVQSILSDEFIVERLEDWKSRYGHLLDQFPEGQELVFDGPDLIVKQEGREDYTIHVAHAIRTNPIVLDYFLNIDKFDEDARTVIQGVEKGFRIFGSAFLKGNISKESKGKERGK